MAELTVKETLALRADVNAWISSNFPEQRKYISHSRPVAEGGGACRVDLHLKSDGAVVGLGALRVRPGEIALASGSCESIKSALAQALNGRAAPAARPESLRGELYEFHLDDGIAAAAAMADRSVDLLLTDPPYSISKPYICESQVPRRLRRNGRDFIMPKGHFGDWDRDFPAPAEWTAAVLPKVGGWAVIFCAHAQIGDYCRLLDEHKFVAVGPMVWRKTNPVPFNHRHKPVNAWEAIVAAKRPGTKFHGKLVHNVFVHKSPSPQQRIHPTQKPLGLLAEFVRLFSAAGETVLDPFAGSAATVVAGVQSGRKVIAYENDPAMFAKAADRLQGQGELSLP